ncbi:RAMP superfamily CRISPR-associated protein [Sorangium sp. So ce381]|uniref:RAMP superfamily CRISPR-associated protein n=1 Tax=Sorangium sp. So ce381 TaxID=3133307 RepID=UPI003F5B9057
MSYEFVPFPDTGATVRRESRPWARHDRRMPGAWFGTLRVEIACHQPIHVGSGFKAEQGGRVVRRTARAGERLVLPGSTLKGVLRARFEAITRSCAFEPPSDRGFIISQSYPDVRRGRLTAAVRQMPIFDERCGRDNRLCAACALFGFQYKDESLQSRVRVADFLADEAARSAVAEMPEQYEPRLHHLGDFRIDRSGREPEFEVSRLYGRKFYVGANPSTDGAPRRQQVEVAPAGTRFCGAIHLFNVDAAELGALLVALGVEPKTYLKIGAGKGHGFGRAAVATVGYQLRDELRRSREPAIDAWRKAFDASGDRWEGGVVKLVEIHERPC